MAETESSPNRAADSIASQVRSAVIWRSGSQILAQTVQWGATFLVIRILSPGDYGLYAMTGVVLAFLNMLNGYGLASGLVQQREVNDRAVGQLFAMLLLLNGGLAIAQLAIAPVAAAYYRNPAVADLLRVQTLLYIANPFSALAYAQLSRAMDFRRQAQVNIVAAIASACVALGGALAGWGVWTLVAAPLTLFWLRAIGMTIAVGGVKRPVFDFAGAGHLARFGGMMAAGQLFWFAQSQADVLIGGRHLTAHDLGLYTTALFLTQIFVAKFVPPLNEIAFSAYARIQDDRAATGAAFLKAVRIIFVAALPFYIGLAATAAPLVDVVLGDQWHEAAPIVRLLALAMPFMTLQVLLTPVCDALGRPGIGVRNGATGAAILAVAFLIGVRWGGVGLAAAWCAAYPLYLAASCRRSLPVIGVTFCDVARAIAPSAQGAALMAVAVLGADALMPPLPAIVRLAALVTIGAATYGAALLIAARGLVDELIGLIRGRTA